MNLEDAVDVFCEAFAYVRSMTHPYLLERYPGTWVLHDAPRRSGNERVREIMICGHSAHEGLEILRVHGQGRFAACIITSDLSPNQDLVKTYKSAGYRLGRTEPIFMRETNEMIETGGPAEIEQVTSEGQALELAQAARTRQITSDQLLEVPSKKRVYVARLNGEMVGWVSSIHLRPESAFVSNLFVTSAHRRKGVGRQLMNQLLIGDREARVKNSVLTASHSGALLYPRCGYKRIGTLHLLIPRR